MKRLIGFLLMLFVPTASFAASSDTQPTTNLASPSETREEHNVRMAWWREARFGMFIHWGLYAVPAGIYQGKQIGSIGEWIMNNAEIPIAEYAKFPPQFNPLQFDADAWVSLAKSAGMKYIVVTAKHHDGFAMFRSQASPFNIYDATPFKRDPIKELSLACAKQGIRFGVYYSQSQDWNHPGGAAHRRGTRKTDHWDPAQDGSFDEYLNTIAVPQVRELLTNYGPIAELWWDTPEKITHEQASRLHALLALQPQVITNNRLGGGFKGDLETPEQRIPANGYANGRDWETCMTINDTWGYKSYDTNFKSTQKLLQNLIDIASKGGNYLLNVGPTAEGIIPPPEVERLEQMGRWLSVNGEAIYGTTAGPFSKRPDWGRATQKPGKLYLHIFNWPDDKKLHLPIRELPTKTYLLAEPSKALAVTETSDGLEIALPDAALDAIATVVVLEHKGDLDVIQPTTQSQTTNGSTTKN